MARNERKFDKCFEIIDPRVRDAGAIKFEAYRTCLSHFIDNYGPLQMLRVDDLKLYFKAADGKGARDFAYALVFAHDKQGRQMEVERKVGKGG